MTLYNLASEYLTGEALLRKRIKELRQMLSEASGEAKEDLLSRIRSLYEMAADAKQIGEFLSQYYGDVSNTDKKEEV